MACFNDIPIEIMEYIFLKLKPIDLKSCRLVCTKWNEAINSNLIWLKMCKLEELVEKEFLEDSFKMITNPMKEFPSDESCSRWRNQFFRYMFIKRNWKMGIFSTSPITFTPLFICQKYALQLEKIDTIKYTEDSETYEAPIYHLVIWGILGGLNKIDSVNLICPELSIDEFHWIGEYILYRQWIYIVCLKRKENSFEEILRIEWKLRSCNPLQYNCKKRNNEIVLAEKLLVLQKCVSPCLLSTYDLTNGGLARDVNIHNAIGFGDFFFGCLEVLGDYIFLSYTTPTRSFMVKYDYSRETWGTPISLENEAKKLYVSKRFVCVKQESLTTHIHILQVWDHLASVKLNEYVISEYSSVILTDDNRLILSNAGSIKIYYILDNFEENIPNLNNVTQIECIWKRYLVVNYERDMSVFDLETKTKLYTICSKNMPFLHDSVELYASETNIILKRANKKFYIISYW